MTGWILNGLEQSSDKQLLEYQRMHADEAFGDKFYEIARNWIKAENDKRCVLM